MFCLLADVFHFLDDVSKGTAFTCTSVTPFSGTGGKRRYPLPNIVEEYIYLYFLKIAARQVAKMKTRDVFVSTVGIEKE